MPVTSSRSGKIDQICAAAVDLARAAIIEDIAGDHVEVVAESERVVTHYFESNLPGYRGWRWAVVVARAPRSKLVTVSETVLLPGPDALAPPEWVPWEERVRPGDLGVGDLMPTPPDDDRLSPGYLLSDDPAVEEVVWELGLGRVRVLSREGRLDAADRWYEGDHGPNAAISIAAPANARCVSCGFFLPLAGAMRAAFGVCANLYAPDDGQVVSGDHGCGAHSEVLVEQSVEVDEAPTIFDDSEVVEVAVEPSDSAEAQSDSDVAASVEAPQVDAAEPDAAGIDEPTVEIEKPAAETAPETGSETVTEPMVETVAEMGAPASDEATPDISRD
jgi:Protein of unknown function (DUF3027)